MLAQLQEYGIPACSHPSLIRRFDAARAILLRRISSSLSAGGEAFIVMQPFTSTASQLCWAGGLSERERCPRFATTTAHSEAGAGDGDDASRIDSADSPCGSPLTG